MPIGRFTIKASRQLELVTRKPPIGGPSPAAKAAAAPHKVTA